MYKPMYKHQSLVFYKKSDIELRYKISIPLRDLLAFSWWTNSFNSNHYVLQKV